MRSAGADCLSRTRTVCRAPKQLFSPSAHLAPGTLLCPSAPDRGRVTACTWECAGERIEVPPPRPKRKPSKSQQQSQPAVSGMHSCIARERGGCMGHCSGGQAAAGVLVSCLPTVAAHGPCSIDCSLSGLHSWLATRRHGPWGSCEREESRQPTQQHGNQHSSAAGING